MGKATEEPVLRKRGHNSGFLGHLLVQVKHRERAARVEPAVQLQVDGAEVDLPQHHAGAAEGPGGKQLLVHLLGQRLPRLVMLGEGVEGLAVVAPVLHELRGELDRVPLHAPDAAHQALLDVGEHVLERMAALVEERLDLAEGHEGGLPADRGRLVADHVGGREADSGPGPGEALGLADYLIHPCTSALLRRAGVGVEVEERLGLPRPGDLVDRHVRVPHGGVHALGLGDRHVEEPLGEGEQPLKDIGECKIWPQLLVRDVVPVLPQALGPEGHVPLPKLLGLPLGPRKLPHFLKLGLCRLVRSGAQLLHQSLGLVKGRHLLRHGNLRVAAVPEERGLLLAQLERPVDDGRVVDVARGGSGDVGAVHLLAEGAVLAVRQHREVGRYVQCEDPGPVLRGGAFVPLRLRGLRRERERGGGETLDLGLVHDELLVGLGGVEEVVAELGRELAQLLLYLVEALPCLALEGNAAEHKVLELALHDPPLRLGEGLPHLPLAERLEALVDRLAL
mmetsp:Transcript_6694/g.16117  ORF Transcript_6694/g.16117 Transcript_6694/m.16117 type:complete len:507 (+) Transcript_6694:437-1957(+)